MLILKKAISPIMLLVLLLTVLPVLSDLQSQYPAASSALQDGSNLSTAAQELDPAANAKVMQDYGKLPLLFIANNGQVDSSVYYYANVAGGRAYLTSDSIVMDLIRRDTSNTPDMVAVPDSEAQQEAYQRLVMRLNFQGANGNPEVICRDMAQGKVNYLMGNDPSKWLTDIPTYQEIVYQDVYPNIDLRLCGREGMLTYDFIVHPGGNVDDIRLALEGVESLELSGRDLVLNTAFGELRQERLSIYQGEGTSRRDIEGNFRLLGEDSYSFMVAAYNSNTDLVIDPGLAYSTYLGSTTSDTPRSIALDAAGNAYVTGYTAGSFPTTLGAFQTVYGGGAEDAFVTKLNPTGSALVYSTYLGGIGAQDRGESIAVDGAGYAHVCGYTQSTNFPTTLGAYQTAFGGGSSRIFVTKLNATGTALLYSTFVGGNADDRGTGIALDTTGNAYISGYTTSTTFPTTPGAYQGTLLGGLDAVVAKLNPTGTAPLLYSTYLGGIGIDYGWSIAVDAAGNAYVGGYTNGNFPTTAGVVQQVFGGGSYDTFVTKLNPTGTAPLVYSTYLGGTTDDRSGMGIAVDAAGNAYFAGWTDSTDFPTTAGYQPAFGGAADAFVTKLNPAGSALVYSSYLGGTGTDYGFDITIDLTGNAYVTGYTYGGFPTTPGAYQTTFGGVNDAFVTQFNSTGSALLYSTYLGGTGTDLGEGIAVDASCCAYVTGYTSGSFPTTTGAFQTTYQGGAYDAFVSKFQMAAPTVTSLNPNYGSLGQTLNVTITGTCFSAPATANFLANITVNTVTVNSATQITANITIANNAALGARNVAVTTPGGTGTLPNSFTVLQPTQSVNTATGTGTATFTTSNGSITGLTAIAQSALTCTGNPVGNFPHGFFSFNIIGIDPGSTVTITITLPSSMPIVTQYWKCINGQWVNATSILGDNNGDNILTLTIIDGSQFDADGVANGTIVDPGGPAVVAAGAAPQASPRASPTPQRLLNPAQMSVQYLSVSPQQTSAGQPVTITTNVVNTGDEAGSYNVALKINGQLETSRTVSVGPQGTQPVKFTLTRAQPGTYAIDIGGQKGTFTVLAAKTTSGPPISSSTIIILIMFVLIISTVVVLMLTFRRPA